jgi:inorganic pyrophosphatase
MTPKTRSKKSAQRPGAPPPPPAPSELPAWDASSGLLHVLVDTPKKSPIKFKYDRERRCYTISHILPPGAVFPFDFGSIPSTLAEDGDPLDVLILMEEPAFAGCLVPVRLVGVLAANQTQEGETRRNDRLIGAAHESRAYRGVRTLRDVPAHLLKEIEHFFVSYNAAKGKQFKVLGSHGPERARQLVQESMNVFNKGGK